MLLDVIEPAFPAPPPAFLIPLAPPPPPETVIRLPKLVEPASFPFPASDGLDPPAPPFPKPPSVNVNVCPGVTG